MARIELLANNAELAGGEVMLVRLARAAEELGHDVIVVGPTYDDGLGAAVAGAGLRFEPVSGGDRPAYLRRLARRPPRSDTDLLWCNGVVPALATRTRRQRRVVELHQVPEGPAALAWRAGHRRGETVVVPSAFLASRVAGAVVLENWTDSVTTGAPSPHPPVAGAPVRVGYLGRLSTDKGVDVLADALDRLEGRAPGRFRLVIGGDDRLVPASRSRPVEERLASCRVALERLGWVGRDAFFSSVDLVVVPSVWDEAFGLAAAEVLGRGLPLVVTDAGALPEVVGPDHPWVARRGDSGHLADVIERQAAEPERVARSVAAGRERWAGRFSPDAGRARLASFLRSLGLEGP